MLKRARDSRAVNVASTQTVDSAASGLGTPSSPTAPGSAPPTIPPAASDSDDDKSDSTDDRSSAADSAASSVPAPPPAPPTIPQPGAGAGAGPDAAARIRDRRADKDAARKAKPPVIPTSPPSGTSAPPVAPPSPPIHAPPTIPSAPTNAEQARAAVDAAGTMVENDKPAEAMSAVRGAMPLLATRDDSVTALFYLAHAMIQRSEKTGDATSRTRACSILTLIGKATAHPKASEIRSLSSQECK
jgi:hypothetical protein